MCSSALNSAMSNFTFTSSHCHLHLLTSQAKFTNYRPRSNRRHTIQLLRLMYRYQQTGLLQTSRSAGSATLIIRQYTSTILCRHTIRHVNSIRSSQCPFYLTCSSKSYYPRQHFRITSMRTKHESSPHLFQRQCP